MRVPTSVRSEAAELYELVVDRVSADGDRGSPADVQLHGGYTPAVSRMHWDLGPSTAVHVVNGGDDGWPSVVDPATPDLC